MGLQDPKKFQYHWFSNTCGISRIKIIEQYHTNGPPALLPQRDIDKHTTFPIKIP